jgi:SOS-response transcriptional repressor LexA
MNLSDQPKSVERKILDFVQEFKTAHQSSPNAEQIADAIGWTSTGGIRNELLKLESKGALAIGVRTRNLTVLD